MEKAIKKSGFMLGILLCISIIIYVLSESNKIVFADPINEMAFIGTCLLGVACFTLSLISK